MFSIFVRSADLVLFSLALLPIGLSFAGKGAKNAPQIVYNNCRANVVTRYRHGARYAFSALSVVGSPCLRPL